jgi:hypothetical protein
LKTSNAVYGHRTCHIAFRHLNDNDTA